MKTRTLLGSISLLALAVSMEACTGGGFPQTGVGVTVTCAGAACGQTGDLFRRVKACGGAVEKQGRQTNVVLASNGLGSEVFGVPAGGWCADAFLDRDGSGTPTAGDIVASTGENSVTVDPDTLFFTTLVLDTSL